MDARAIATVSLVICVTYVLFVRRDAAVQGDGLYYYPLAALPAIVLISVTMTFATNRYRAISEGALVVLAAVAIDAGVQWLHTDRRRTAAADATGTTEDETDERVLTGS